MKILRVRHEQRSAARPGPLVATLGSFDGIHRGHQQLLAQVVNAARATGRQSALITFLPHPSVALGKTEQLPLITTLRQRCEMLAQIGLDYLIIISFTKDLGALEYADFCSLYLRTLLDVERLFIGPDARIGKGAKGTAPLIKEAMEQQGAAVDIVTSVAGPDTNEKISSRTVRDAIATGDIGRAALLLGRPFTLEGRVVHGEARGRQIGFPTANLHVLTQVVPAKGVYGGWLTAQGQRYAAVCNIGVRPTVSTSQKLSVEVHAITAHQLDLYGSRVSFECMHRLRDEKRFESIDALKDQIAQDIERTRFLLKIKDGTGSKN